MSNTLVIDHRPSSLNYSGPFPIFLPPELFELGDLVLSKVGDTKSSPWHSSFQRMNISGLIFNGRKVGVEPGLKGFSGGVEPQSNFARHLPQIRGIKNLNHLFTFYYRIWGRPGRGQHLPGGVELESNWSRTPVNCRFLRSIY
jgi:hypothetical protein